MKTACRIVWVAILTCLWPAASHPAAPSEREGAAELDACRQTGKALYENDDFKAAADQFRRCLELAPDSAADHFNLGLVLMRAADHTNALAALARAEQLDPSLLGPHYLRGIIHKREGAFDLAIASLRRVVAADPTCVGAYYNLGICHKLQEEPQLAIAAFRAALEHDPQNPSCHYQLITLYRQTGDVENATRHAEIYDRLKDTLDESEKTVEALERSNYSQILAVPPLGPDLEPLPGSAVRFVDITATAGFAPPSARPRLPPPLPNRFRADDYDPAQVARQLLPRVGGAVTVGDYDGDGDLDVYLVNCSADPAASANRLYRNEGGCRFVDVTSQAGVDDCHLGRHAVFGDFDNDGHPDLYVLNYGPNVLYRNRGDGTFQDVSEQARVNEPQFGSRTAFLDYDHDNDLDLFIANNLALTDPPQTASFAFPDDLPGQVNTLLRNNGNGTFTDQTDEAGLLIDSSQTRDLVFADFDGDHDADLFAVNFDAPSRLFLNARLGKFTPGGSFSPPLPRHARAAAEADFNRDGRPDLVVAVETALLLYTNSGRANFTAGADLLPSPPSAPDLDRIAVLDYNNDGWADLLLLRHHAAPLQLLAGSGPGRFQDQSAASALDQVQGTDVADVAAADLDQDGDLDLVVQTRDRGPLLLRNEGGSCGHWLQVKLRGKKVNQAGLGATVEIAAGGHYQKQTVRGDGVHFGLGNLQSVPVVRVTWPNGVAQNVIRPPLDRPLQVEEYVKVSASCAFLWADAGHGYQLINEILGVAPLGVRSAPDQYFPLDCTELTKINPDQLSPSQGVYELRLTEELREIAYLDQANLRVIDHPNEFEIIPNEMFSAPPFPEDRFFAVADHRVPRAATDDCGHDVLELIRRRDGQCPTFPHTRYDGLAQLHSLTLDLGDLSQARQIMLCLDGWIYWADSSVSAAIFQNPDHDLTPLKLEVRDADGHWQTALPSVGLPTSKGAVVPVDLTGRFPARDWHVRLSTTLCVYFDRIFVFTDDLAAQCRTTHLPVAQANLHFRGFARLSRDPLGYERFEYEPASPTGSWDPPQGMFTRYGEVTPLLAQPDDHYVILGPGDELTLQFQAGSLPELPPGWTRSFIFYANGWVKDGDLNTTCSQTVEPLPFHGMSGYPYPAGEHYPDTPAHRRYRNTYNTRPSRPTVGKLSPAGG